MYLSQVYCIHHPRLTGKHSLSKSCTSHCSMQRFLGPFNHTPPSTHTHTRDKETSGLALSALSVPHPDLPPTNSSMSLFHYHVPFRHQTAVEAFHARDCTSTSAPMKSMPPTNSSQVECALIPCCLLISISASESPHCRTSSLPSMNEGANAVNSTVPLS